ncbi:MAG: hypothetical protein EBT39_04705 [Sphingobacteriia bacterium]|nr:hypothetical protein [Candidatus Fonsibacter lacus]
MALIPSFYLKTLHQFEYLLNHKHILIKLFCHSHSYLQNLKSLPLLIEKNPDITFGEISGETSRRWKEFTPEQKAQYKSTEARENEIPVPNVAVLVEPKEKKVPKESKSRPVKKANNSLECKKLPELKEMCKEHGLTTTGKKQDLIDRLKNVNREEHLSPVVALSDAEDSDNDSHNDNDNPRKSQHRLIIVR